jgi:hypothetical protein
MVHHPIGILSIGSLRHVARLSTELDGLIAISQRSVQIGHLLPA